MNDLVNGVEYPPFIIDLVDDALAEDIGTGDVTAELLPIDKEVTAQIITREPGIICGVDFVNVLFYEVAPSAELSWHCYEGDAIEADEVLCDIKGNARQVLTAERAALNFLQTLSSTATATAQYVKAVAGTHACILDTRKTIPGMRIAQKYAVSCGGGKNHRMGLDDAFLIKENHIMACGSITNAIEKARTLYPDLTLEVEVENLTQFEEAITTNADVIMLDNFSLADMRQAVNMNPGSIKLEASGGITLDNVLEVAKTGVDYISVGAITKHVRALDLSMRVVA